MGTIVQEADADFLAGGGQMGRRLRDYDWGSHPLGPPKGWPQALRTVVRLALTTNHPVFVFWGPELFCFYNDAYSVSLGPEKHPAMLGARGRDVWPEIWSIIGPQIEQVMTGKGATWHENHLVPIIRRGALEEVYWTYSYSPIDHEGGIGGVLVICRETTQEVLEERRRAEDLDRWRRAFEQAPSFICTLSGPDHVFDFVNAQHRRLFGDRALGKPWREAFPELVAQGFGRLLDKVYTTGERHVGRATPAVLTAEDGSREELFLDFIYEPIRDSSGRMTGIFCEGHDVTAQVRSEAALRESERDLRKLTDNLPVLISYIDANRRYRFVNGTYEAWFGHDRATIEGRHMRDVLGESAYAMLAPAIDRVLGGERFAFESRVPYKDGGTREVRVEYVPRRDDEGAVTGFYALVQDIGDRKQTEAALRESEARYRALFENIDAGFCIIEMIFDAEGRPVDYRFIDTNPEFERQAGFAGASGRRMREIVPEHEDYWFERYGQVAMTGEAVQFEEGSTALGRWWDVHAFRVGAPEQRQVAVLFTDVTARRRADFYLRANETRLRFLNELMDATSGLVDADGILAATTRMLGEHLGVDVCAYADMEPDEDAFTIRGDWSAPGAASIVGRYSLADFGRVAVEKLRAGKPLVINDNIAELGEEQSKEFLRIGLRATVCMPFLKEGRLTALMAVHCTAPHHWSPEELALLAEVTGRSWAHIERVRSEAALKESEARFRNMADHAPVMMWVTDAGGYCTYLNRMWFEFTGQTREEAEGFGWLNATHPEDTAKAERVFHDATERGAPFVMEYRLRRADGVYRWAMDAAAPRFGQGGEFLGYIGSVIDIHQRRQAESQLHDMNEELERRIKAALQEQTKAEEELRQAQKLEAMGQLTSGVAHDFNNLLMIVQAGLTLLERSNDKSRRDMLTARMREAVTRGANLTQQLLAFSRRQELSPEAVDFADLMNGMADLLDRSLGANVEVQLDMAENLAPIFVDPNALQLTILNLAVNARDAMPKGGTVRINAANGTPKDSKAPFVCVSVIDTGVGISPEVRERMFDPFFTTKEIGKGSGLGLAQVHGFAQQSGGHIEVDSEPGNGTRMVLVLPQSKTQAYPALKLAAGFRAPRATGQAGHVLLVEDDNEVAALTGEMLAHLGWQVTRAASAEAALGALANDRDVDLVFSDVMMPGGMSGLDLAREVRRRRPALPIILASGYSEGVRREAEQAGLPLLPKPYNLDTLAAVIEVARLN